MHAVLRSNANSHFISKKENATMVTTSLHDASCVHRSNFVHVLYVPTTFVRNFFVGDFLLCQWDCVWKSRRHYYHFHRDTKSVKVTQKNQRLIEYPIKLLSSAIQKECCLKINMNRYKDLSDKPFHAHMKSNTNIFICYRNDWCFGWVEVEHMCVLRCCVNRPLDGK